VAGGDGSLMERQIMRGGRALVAKMDMGLNDETLDALLLCRGGHRGGGEGDEMAGVMVVKRPGH
jgi:hypothetical protein